MAQYLEMKRNHPDAMLFFRMGDFYELFFDDAILAGQALGITQTFRGTHNGQPIPMAGVPHHAAEGYLARLIKAGYRVAVCEQTEDPAEAKKRGSKAVVRREIVRIVTPGTITEESLLEARSANCLAAIGLAGGGREAALALADVSTGRFEVFPLTPAALADVLGAIGPREVLVADSVMSQPDVARATDGLTLTPRPDARADAKLGERLFRDAYGVSTLDGFGTFTRAELIACGLLFDYLAVTQAGGQARLDPPIRTAPDTFLAIDPATRASLEIERSTRGARQGSLVAAVDRTVTAAGARLLALRLSRPSRSRTEIEQRFDAVAFFLDASDKREFARDALKRASDIERARMRLSLRRGGPRDLAALAACLAVGEQICADLSSQDDPPAEIASACAALTLADKPRLGAFAQQVSAALARELPVQARDGGFIAAGHDPALDETRSLKEDARGVIARLEVAYATETGISGLRIKHNNVLGFFIEVNAKHGDQLMKPPLAATFIHRQTMANAMRFSTTQLSELEAKISRADGEALAREMEIFNRFLAEADALGPELALVADGLARLDVAAGNADWAAEASAPCVPRLRMRRCSKRRARAILLSRRRCARGGQGFTANDCRLDARGSSGPRLMLITGPNMAGKSTFLRQNVLLAILAQAGCYVPARRLRLGLADRVFSRVGASDDLSRGRSTFMVEMIETAAILNQATQDSIVILDEVGRGTSTYDGLAIAWAAVEHLHEVNKCRALFATHYHELTGLADTLAACANASLRAQEWKGDLVFLHEVKPGPADRSYGVQVAKLAGLPSAAVKRAEAVLKKLEAKEGGAKRLEELPLFANFVAEEPEVFAPSEADQMLATLDPDTLTPKEALELVYRLKAATKV